MTLRIPKALAIVVGLLLALGGGALLGYYVGGETVDPVTTSETITDTSTTTEAKTVTDTVAEAPPVEAFAGLLGANVIRDLIDQGEIEEAVPVEPKEGWETEFELDGGEVDIRFQVVDGQPQVEWVGFRGPLFDAIEDVAIARGYTEVLE